MSVLASPEYVSAGSRMVWHGEFHNWLTSFSESPTQAIIDVQAYLKNNYSLIVERSVNNVGFGTGTGTIDLYLRTDIDRGDGETDDGLTDIQNNVNDAFSKQVGVPVLGSTITNYQSAATGPTTPPDMNPGNDSGGSDKKGCTSTDFAFDNLGCWWDDLTKKVEAGTIGFAIGAVVVIGVIVFLSVKSSATV